MTIAELIAIAGDTYHNRFAPDRKHNKGDKSFKPLKKKCSKCGTTSGQLDINHKDGNRNNNNRSNLSYMCRSCHRKMHAAKNGGKGEFIVSTAARIISDPNTDESKAIAAANKNSDLMHIEFILCHADVNANQDRFTPDDLEASANTAVNKPINWEHKNNNIGAIYESKYVNVSDLESEAKAYYGDIDPLKKDFVVCRGVIWEYKNPAEARVVRERAADNNLFFSMENRFGKAKCSECDEEFASPFEYCDHLLSRRQTGETDRIFIDSNLVGAAVTRNPADKFAGTLAIANIERGLTFASLVKSKLISTINIENELIPYIVLAKEDEMEIRKIEVPKEFSNKLELPEEAFADFQNKIFPIDNAENIKLSGNLILNKELNFYKSDEKLVILERLSEAAREYDIDLKQLIIPTDGGKEQMDINVNSPEFQSALEKAVAERMKEVESGNALKEAQDANAALQTEFDTTKANLEKETSAKSGVQKEFDEFKADLKIKEIAEARWNTLSEKGFAFDENADKVKANIASMDEESYASFVAILEETKSKAEAAFNFDKKKKEGEDEEKEMSPEEKKKKKMEDEKAKNKAKASKEDPVNESNTAIANKVDDGNNEDSEYAAIDKALKFTLGLSDE